MSNSFALDATHERILQWLSAYPFQRLEDLVIALGTWSRRTSIYTHLKDLERVSLVEALALPWGQGKHVYHLAPAGAVWCLQRRGALLPPSKSAANQPHLREILAHERAALVRLLPRLPVLLDLQTVMNSLVSGAATALARQGHRADLVRWNWQRDAIHTFTYHGRPARWFADGLGSFCLSFVADEQVSRQVWYRFFLLYTPFTHRHLMRARLDRLMRWRESQERWQTYTQMPPILILATTPRQAEWWHEAAERVIQDLKIKRPLGAIAVLSQEGSMLLPLVASLSVWHLSWKLLGTARACHLQDLFLPQIDAAFPDLFPHEDASLEVGEKRVTEYVVPRRRHYNLTARVQSSQKQKNRQANWRLHSLILSRRQWEILAFLQAHPLLTRADLCAHLGLEDSSLRHLLSPMERMYLVQHYHTSVGQRFALAEAGLRIMAAAARCHVRYLLHRSRGGERTPGQTSKADTSFLPRGVPGLLAQIEHLAGVYGFASELASKDLLNWWETGTLCTRVYLYQDERHGIRPDMVAECTTLIGGQPEGRSGVSSVRSWRFFLEWDRGTMRQRDLQRKLNSYALYYTSREWAREHQTPPTLLFVAPDMAQEQLLERIALIKLRDRPAGITLYTTTLSLLAMRGVSAPIWKAVLSRSPPDKKSEQLHMPVSTRIALFAHLVGE